MATSTFTVYQTLIAAYKRVGRDTAELALRIDAAAALGRLSTEEYGELILSVGASTDPLAEATA